MLIKEVEELLSMSSHTLRYYEKMGLISPNRDINGYRNYSDEDIVKLKKIRYLRDLDIPIENIVDIMNGNVDFQEVLENHIKTLETKIKSLQYVSDICNDLKEKEIPLLTALTDDKIVKEEKINEGEFKKGLKKVVEFFKPLKTVVIGARNDRSHFLSAQPLMIFLSLIMGVGIGVGLPNMIEYVNNQGVMEPIKIFDANMISILIASLLSYVIVFIILLYINGLQRYIELTDIGLYVCDYRKRGWFSIVMGTLMNDSRSRNVYYSWEELTKVEINMTFQRAREYRVATSTMYIPKFKFCFMDGEVFEIDSGLAFDEDVSLAYKILKDKRIDIIAEEHIKRYFEQDEISGYVYFESIYHKNSKVQL